MLYCQSPNLIRVYINHMKNLLIQISKNWIFIYVFFEVNLIKELGYDTNLQSFNDAIEIFSIVLKKSE